MTLEEKIGEFFSHINKSKQEVNVQSKPSEIVQASTIVTPTIPEPVIEEQTNLVVEIQPQEEKIMANAFVSFLEAAGKDVEKVFTDFITPSNVAAVTGLVTAFDAPVGVAFNLIANTVISVEQKFAAIGKQSGTGAQKLAQVIAIIGSTLASLIPGVNITNIVNAVVSFLNSIQVTPATAPATPAVA